MRRFQPGELGLDPGDPGSKPARLVSVDLEVSDRAFVWQLLERRRQCSAIASRTRRIPGFGRLAKVSMAYIPTKDGAAPADWAGRDDHASAGIGASIHALMLPASGNKQGTFRCCPVGGQPGYVCRQAGKELFEARRV